MTKWTVITLSAALAMALLGGVARADSDVDVSVRVGGGQWDYDYSSDWFWGDSVLYGDFSHRRGGLGFSFYDDDWNRRFSATSQYGAHPNDRGGYRAFIPRGRQGPPELYGGYIVDEDGYPIRPRYNRPNYPRNHYRRHRNYGYPVVIPYTYGYGYSPDGYYPTPIYSAPAYPDYGYYPPSRGYDPYAYERDDYTDRSVTNNFYGDTYIGDDGDARAVEPEVRYVPVEPQAAGPPAPVAAQPAGQAMGARFTETLRLSTPDGDVRFTLLEGKLYAGPETGPGELVSSGAEMSFGAFAAWLPGAGAVVIFREEATIAAAYRTPAGEWWVEKLPYNVDFSGTTSIGLVGGRPWVTFTALDGARYVVAFSGELWQDIGSGSPSSSK